MFRRAPHEEEKAPRVEENSLCFLGVVGKSGGGTHQTTCHVGYCAAFAACGLARRVERGAALALAPSSVGMVHCQLDWEGQAVLFEDSWFCSRGRTLAFMWNYLYVPEVCLCARVQFAPSGAYCVLVVG